MCTEQESNYFNEDIFQSTSLSDLFQTSTDVPMSYYMADDEPLTIPPMLPMLSGSELSPPNSTNVFDMISQDMLLGSSMQSSSLCSSTEVTYASQYASTSTAPFTSAGDVFLPNLPITTASNTFVKPINTFVQPSPPSRNSNTIIKPSARHGSCSTTSKSSKPVKPGYSNQIVNQLHANETGILEPYVATTRQPSRLKTTARYSTKNSLSKSIGLHTLVETPSRSSSLKHGRNRPKEKKTLLSHSKSAFVPVTSRGGRSAAITHTITRAADSLTDASVSFDTETVTFTTSTITPSATSDSIQTYLNSFRTGKVMSTTSKKTSAVTYASSYSHNITTSTFTSYTTTRSKAPASIISPMQSTYTVAAGTIHSSSKVIPRKPLQSAGRSARIPRSSLTSDEACEQNQLLPKSTAATTVGDRVLPLLVPTAVGRVIANATILPHTTAKARVASSIRTAKSTPSVTIVHTCATSTVTCSTASRVRAQKALVGLSPGATLYAARNLSSARLTRSQNIPVTTESKTFAILDGKGSFTTLTISSDFATTTCSSVAVSETQSLAAVTAGLDTHTSSITTDSIVRPGSHMLISLPNSQMSPSTSLSYLISPPLRSDIMPGRRAPASPLTQTPTTTIGTHTITTISSEVMNRIRSRLIIPVAHTSNVPNSPAALTTLSASTLPKDSNRTRGPVTIIANQLLTAVSARDVSSASTTTASTEVSSIRPLFSPSRNVYTITAPVSSHLTSTIVAEPGTRSINRVVIPVIPSVHATSNVQNTTTTVTMTSSTTAPKFSAGTTQGTYLIATGMGASSSHAGGTTGRPSRVIIPIIHNTSATIGSTAVANVTTSPFSRSAGEDAHTSSIGNIDVQSRLRNRLIIQTTTAESSLPCTTTPITAYTMARTRTSQSVYTIPSTQTSHTSLARHSDTTTLNPATMTLITFEPPSSAIPTTTMNAQNILSPDSTPTTPSSCTGLSSVSTAKLPSTGNRYVIKLASTITGSTCVSSVTAAVTSPITTAAVSPPGHRFVEPQPVSRLRTFPGPRTYSVAQRSTAGNVTQRTPVHTVAPRAGTKKVNINPAPLQIFADVVCPPTSSNTMAATTIVDHTKPQFSSSHRSGSSTPVVSQYKSTVFKNLSSLAQTNTERASSRSSSTRSSSDRFILNRAVVPVTARRSTPRTQAESQIAQTTSTVTQRTGRQLRFTYADMRSSTGRITPVATATEATQSTTTEAGIASNNVSFTSDK